MEQALKDERLVLHLRHNEAREKINALRAEQLAHHKRITEIDAIEQGENRNLDPSLDQGVHFG